MFPVDVIKVDIKPITFNGRRIKEVYIDLDHINRGKEGRSARSALSTEDVLRLVFLLNDLDIESEMMRGSYSYFQAILRDEFEKPYKLIFCQDHSLSWIGVITLFRIREKNEN